MESKRQGMRCSSNSRCELQLQPVQDPDKTQQQMRTTPGCQIERFNKMAGLSPE